MTTPKAASNKRLKLDVSKDITILVGEAEEKFTVHRSFLKSSKYLEKCCEGPWKESEANTIRLPNVFRETFTISLQWLYTGEIVIEEDEENTVFKANSSTPEGREVTGASYNIILDLAILGDQLDDQCFRNKINDTTINSIERLKITPPNEHYFKMYKDLPESSLHKKLLVDRYAAAAGVEAVKGHKGKLPADFMYDVTYALVHARAPIMNGKAEVIRLEVPRSANRCKYHEHRADEPKCTPA